MRYCAYQERCIHDLKLKNHEWKLNAKEFEGLINELKEDNFLNEERYVESYVKGKFHLNKWGKLKIQHALHSKNIDSTMIDEKLNLISDEEYSKTIEELLTRKMAQLKADPNKKLKAQRYLLSKGYELDLVYQLASKLQIRN